MNCPHCGQKMPFGARVCPHCRYWPEGGRVVEIVPQRARKWRIWLRLRHLPRHRARRLRRDPRPPMEPHFWHGLIPGLGHVLRGQVKAGILVFTGVFGLIALGLALPVPFIMMVCLGLATTVYTMSVVSLLPAGMPTGQRILASVCLFVATLIPLFTIAEELNRQLTNAQPQVRIRAGHGGILQLFVGVGEGMNAAVGLAALVFLGVAVFVASLIAADYREAHREYQANPRPPRPSDPDNPGGIGSA